MEAFPRLYDGLGLPAGGFLKRLPQTISPDSLVEAHERLLVPSSGIAPSSLGDMALPAGESVPPSRGTCLSAKADTCCKNSPTPLPYPFSCPRMKNASMGHLSGS